MSHKGRWVKKALAFALLALVALAALGLIVMLLWNALVPALFGGPRLSYLQAAGLLVLSRILFGRLWLRHGRWRDRMWRKHWENLTPEERERLMDKYRRHCHESRCDAHHAPQEPKP